MVNAPNISLKAILISHFVLSLWASMTPGYLGTPYLYLQGFVLTFGVWALINPESVEASFMFLLMNVISIVLDIILVGVYAPMGHAAYEVSVNAQTSLYRFSLGMSITNLLVKPFTSFVLYRIYQDRGGQYGDFSIPGVSNFGVGGGAHLGGGQYEDIDHPVPSNNVESASPHSTIDKPLP